MRLGLTLLDAGLVVRLASPTTGLPHMQHDARSIGSHLGLSVLIIRSRSPRMTG